MPGMNGHELADRLKAQFPGLRTIFMSGNAEEEVREIVGHLPRLGFIQKPFTTLQLVARVQDILEFGCGGLKTIHARERRCGTKPAGPPRIG